LFCRAFTAPLPKNRTRSKLARAYHAAPPTHRPLCCVRRLPPVPSSVEHKPAAARRPGWLGTLSGSEVPCARRSAGSLVERGKYEA
jgi:hypothetical protein